MLPVHRKVLVTLRSFMSSHCLTAPALSSRQSSALGPQERAPREVSVHLHAQWISGFPSPSLALVLVVSFFRWPSSLLSRSPILTVSPPGSRWRLSLQPTYLRSRPSEERETRAQTGTTFAVQQTSQKCRSALCIHRTGRNLVTWLHRAVGEPGK